jgi:hypothetical protein
MKATAMANVLAYYYTDLKTVAESFIALAKEVKPGTNPIKLFKAVIYRS